MEKRVVELFAGVGGFRVGLNNAKLVNDMVKEEGGWDFVWANQWEPGKKNQSAFDCYVKRFGSSENHVNKDISTVDKASIPDHTLLVGGFPCQDYSVARSLSGEKGIEGKKGVLWWQIAEIVKTKTPPFMLLENVDRLIKSPSRQRGKDFGIMLRTLHDLGYIVEWRIVNAAEYGFAQRRRRVFIFASRKDTKYARLLLEKSDLGMSLIKEGMFESAFPSTQFESTKKQTISSVSTDDFNDLVEVSNRFKCEFYNSGVMINAKIFSREYKPQNPSYKTFSEIMENEVLDEKFYINESKLDSWRKLKGAKKIQRTKPNGELYSFSEGSLNFPDLIDMPGRTMLTSESTLNRSSHVYEDKSTGKLRLITPLEAERLNCFPDGWTNTGMPIRERYFMMGNALVCGVIGKIGKELEEIISKE